MTETTEFMPAEATETFRCPVCGTGGYSLKFEAGDYEYRLPGRFYISRCDGCGLVFQQPRPPFDDILRYYLDEYEGFRPVGSSIMQSIRHRFLVQPRINRYRRLACGLGRPADLLDVGCAHGDLLEELSGVENLKCVGIEPVPHAVEIAGSRGLNVNCTTLEKFDCPDESFDIVVMNHVLEHLANPEEITGIVHRILRRGGVFSGETPCSRSFEDILFRRYNSIYHLPRHIFFFSPALMRCFLEKFGFADIEITLQPTPSCWQGSVRNFLHSRTANDFPAKLFSGHSVLLNAMSFPPAFLLAKLGFAPIMHFTARK